MVGQPKIRRTSRNCKGKLSHSQFSIPLPQDQEETMWTGAQKTGLLLKSYQEPVVGLWATPRLSLALTFQSGDCNVCLAHPAKFWWDCMSVTPIWLALRSLPDISGSIDISIVGSLPDNSVWPSSYSVGQQFPHSKYEWVKKKNKKTMYKEHKYIEKGDPNSVRARPEQL